MSGFFPALARPFDATTASSFRVRCQRLAAASRIARFNGYAPLNFISGGSVRDESGVVLPDRTHSDSSARTDIILVGVNVAF